jgi:L-gulonolactone oxidase
MSVDRAVAALQKTKFPNPVVRAAGLAELRDLRESHPGAIRAAARRLGASSVTTSALPPGAWANWIGEQDASPQTIATPARLNELRGLLSEAVNAGRRVKAVASGHSTSAVARPDDGEIAVNIGSLDRILARHSEKSRLPAYARGPNTDLVRVQAGITIKRFSQLLLAKGLALPNSGSFDGQQLIGALCTGTHGSGVAFPTLADMVMSLDILAVVPGPRGHTVRKLRIERTDGITDPRKFARPQDLIQDDAVFGAAVVSFGTLGIVVSATVKVVKKFWMKETRQFMPWSQLKPQLAQVARSADHVDVHINPYRDASLGPADHSCVVIRRQRIPWRNQPPPDRPADQNFVKWAARTFGSDLLGWFATEFPGVVADGMDRYCRNETSFTSASYKVLITGLGYDIEATSTELAVDLQDAGHMVQTVLDIAHQHRDMPRPARIRHSSPLGLRFVKKSGQLLSQHRGGVNATLEIPFVLGTKNREFALKTYYDALPNARPHWGQKNWLTSADVARLYGSDWTAWKAVYDRFNPLGTWNNRYTGQLGIDR